MFNFDEAAVNERLGRMLDALPPNRASRSDDFPAPSWPVLLWLASLAKLRPFRSERIEIGVTAVVEGRLARNEDAVALIVQQILDALMAWITKYRATVGYPLAVGPLKFEYEESVFPDGETWRLGVEAIVTAQVEWSALG